HGVYGVLELTDLAFHFHSDLPGQVAFGNGRRDVGDVAHLVGEVARHGIHIVGQVLPRPAYASDLGLATELPLGPHLAGDTSHFRREGIQLVDHRVNGLLELQEFALHLDGDFLGKVAFGDGRRDVRDVAHLVCKVRGHGVYVIRQVLPYTGDALDSDVPPELHVCS